MDTKTGSGGYIFHKNFKLFKKLARVHVHYNKLRNASLFFIFLTVDYSFQTFTSEHTMGADELANIGNRLIDVYLLLARHMAMIDYISKPVEKK